MSEDTIIALLTDNVIFTAAVHSTYVLHTEIQGSLKQHKEVATWDEAKIHCEAEGKYFVHFSFSLCPAVAYLRL